MPRGPTTCREGVTQLQEDAAAKEKGDSAQFQAGITSRGKRWLYPLPPKKLLARRKPALRRSTDSLSSPATTSGGKGSSPASRSSSRFSRSRCRLDGLEPPPPLSAGPGRVLPSTAALPGKVNSPQPCPGPLALTHARGTGFLRLRPAYMAGPAAPEQRSLKERGSEIVNGPPPARGRRGMDADLGRPGIDVRWSCEGIWG